MSEPLFRIEDVPDGDSAGFIGEVEGRDRSLIAIRKGEAVYVYLNRCPHVGAPLDWRPGQFLNSDKTMILCTVHGAMFEIEDGTCLFGPCYGDGLEPVEIDIRNGAVYARLQN
jgi:nitrite reductase/ring-hydroxylating ferredoxin subunit